jgi:DNA polymerase III delta prime subunit
MSQSNINNISLISKYKPQTIDEFCMDASLRTVITTLLDIDDMNVLFVGGACSGKTILLNAIVREYYGLSRNDPIPENNILFINNLKEQGINFYRNEMKTFCQSHSIIRGKKKMIIIDDIDMINEQSQQVFRNNIDKYKHNIHFVSVCSNIQKVIESIQSRLHIIKLQPPTKSQILTLSKRITHEENIKIDEESQLFLMSYCQYSIRSLINYLEKIKILDISVTKGVCQELITDISFRQFEQYILYIRANNLSDAISVVYEIYDYGYSVIDILEYMFTFVKITHVMTEDEVYKVIPILCKFITIFNTTHEDVIELALFTNNIHSVLKSPSLQ